VAPWRFISPEPGLSAYTGFRAHIIGLEKGGILVTNWSVRLGCPILKTRSASGKRLVSQRRRLLRSRGPFHRRDCRCQFQLDAVLCRARRRDGRGHRRLTVTPSIYDQSFTPGTRGLFRIPHRIRAADLSRAAGCSPNRTRISSSFSQSLPLLKIEAELGAASLRRSPLT